MTSGPIPCAASDTGETYRLGDKVEVKLVEAAPVAGALRFELLTKGALHRQGPAAGAKKGGHGNRTAPGRRRRLAPKAAAPPTRVRSSGAAAPDERIEGCL